MNNLLRKNTYTEFKIVPHRHNKRIIEFVYTTNLIKKFLLQTKQYSIQALEYKPFARFALADALDKLTKKEISLVLSKILHDRKCGCVIVRPDKKNLLKNKDQNIVKFSAAISHLIGIPNFDSMAQKFYARFTVAHSDKSDSYLRKAYIKMDLHTDGTYVSEKTDWVLMAKIYEKNCLGGQTNLLHLDDWEDLNQFKNNPIGKENFVWSSPRSKNINYKVKHPIFSKGVNGNPTISYIDQFPEPETREQGSFLKKLSTSLEASNYITKLEILPGELILLNNNFWLHGREPFKKNKKLKRELLRQRGVFYKTT